MADQELVPVKPAEPWRDPKSGKFTRGVPGHGRNPGSMNRVNKEVKARMADLIASGKQEHPAIILLQMANDPEIPPGIRRSAASELLPYLLPMKLNVEVESSEMNQTVEYERIRETLRVITGAK